MLNWLKHLFADQRHKVTVTFPDEEVLEHGSVRFPALVDGARVECTISLETLQNSFNLDSPNDVLYMFRANRPEIEALVETMLEAGEAENGQLKIESVDFVSGH